MSLLDNEDLLLENTTGIKTLIEDRDGERVIKFNRDNRNRFNVGDVVYLIQTSNNWDKCKIVPRMIFGIQIHVEDNYTLSISYRIRNENQYGDQNNWVEENKVFKSKEEAVAFMLSGYDSEIFTDLMRAKEEKTKRKQNSILNKIKKLWQK